MRRATAYLRGDKIVVHSSSQTTDGVWILHGPCVALPDSCSDDDLGGAVRSALERSRDGVPHPVQWRGLVAPLLTAAGVKSWKAFANGAVCVEIELRGDAVVFIPTTNLGPDEGFEALPGRNIETAPDSATALGAGLRAALLEAA